MFGNTEGELPPLQFCCNLLILRRGDLVFLVIISYRFSERLPMATFGRHKLSEQSNVIGFTSGTNKSTSSVDKTMVQRLCLLNALNISLEWRFQRAFCAIEVWRFRLSVPRPPSRRLQRYRLPSASEDTNHRVSLLLFF